jgi:hypothetical protein
MTKKTSILWTGILFGLILAALTWVGVLDSSGGLLGGLVLCVSVWFLIMCIPSSISVGGLEIPAEIQDGAQLKQFLKSKEKSLKYFWRQYGATLLRESYEKNSRLFSALFGEKGVVECVESLAITPFGSIPEENIPVLIKILRLHIKVSNDLSDFPEELLIKVFRDCDLESEIEIKNLI